jgi:hypothetical protein
MVEDICLTYVFSFEHRYECELCQMAFKNKVALGIHKGRQHKSDKPAKVRNIYI